MVTRIPATTSDNSLTFHVGANEGQTVSLGIEDMSANGLSLETASVSGSVTAVNDAPVARADSFTTAEDTAIILNPLQNDADPEGDALVTTTAA